MAIVGEPAFRIYRGERLYDDEQPLNKNTPKLDFHRPVDDPAPYTVVVQGPRSVGKSLLIKSLVKKFTENSPTDDQGPITIHTARASGKVIHLQFVECPYDINGMIDAAKYADVAILMVDASYGFEMETFEFRNLLQVHGFPKVIGVLTHLDMVGQDKISEVKQRLMDHFCTEICEGANLSSLSGLKDGLYKMPEIDHLGEMLSDPQFLPSSWRSEHPYMLADRFEDVMIGGNRYLSLYGYLRGSDIKTGAKVHIAGAGDFSLARVTKSSGPCNSFGDLDTYTRLDVLDVPPEIVANLDPHHPILVADILPEEENYGYIQVKLRRHSWHLNLLMTGTPITVSAGWRRYETIAVYATENENGQHRLLNYTPEHKDCVAVFWGPLAPPKTRIVAVVNKFYRLIINKEGFRIMATGIVLDFNRDAQILLKVNKMGTLVHTGEKTAHIKFAPEIEVDRFIGASIQTKSGILGKIDEASGGQIVNCTFMDDIDKSDSFLFPVLATLVLPSLFKQLNLLFKPMEVAIDGLDATIAAVVDAVDTAVAPAVAAAVLDEPAVSFTFKMVAPRPQMPDLRRGVVIHEGKPLMFTFHNPLELFYSYVKRKLSRRANKEKNRYMAEETPVDINEKISLGSGEVNEIENLSLGSRLDAKLYFTKEEYLQLLWDC